MSRRNRYLLPLWLALSMVMAHNFIPHCHSEVSDHQHHNEMAGHHHDDAGEDHEHDVEFFQHPGSTHLFCKPQSPDLNRPLELDNDLFLIPQLISFDIFENESLPIVLHPPPSDYFAFYSLHSMRGPPSLLS